MVKDIRTELVNTTNTNTNLTNTNTGENSTTINVTKANNNSANDNQNTNQEEILTADENSVATTTEAPCANLKTWLVIIALLAYGFMMTFYFRYEHQHKSNGWWIFPVLLTVIAWLFYYKNFCPQTYLWWPWVMLGIGGVITIWYKIVRKSPDIGNQNELPF